MIFKIELEPVFGETLFLDATGLHNSKSEVDPSRPLNPERIKTAEAWIMTNTVETITVTKLHSYSLKHQAENWGSRMGKHFESDIFSSYVSNGDFIQAAINQGYTPYQIRGGINARFKFKLKVVNCSL